MKKHPWQTLGGLPRASWFLAFATLVNRAGTMVIVFLALYFTRELGYSADVVSALFALYGIGALAGAPIAGRLCDRLGPAPVLAGFLASSGAVLLVMPFARTLPTVAATMLAFAVLSEGVRPSLMTVAGALVPPERRKSAFVLNRLAVNLGMSIGPMIGGLLAEDHPRLLFLLDGGTSLIAAVLLVVTVPRVAPAPPAGDADPRARAGVLRDRRFLRFLVGVVLVGLVFFQLEAAMPLYVVGQLGVSKPNLGVMFSINTVMILVFEVPLNGATEAWSHRRSLAAGALFVGLGMGGLVFVRGFAGASCCIATLTVGEMILFPALSSFVADVSPEGRTGTYMGTYAMAFAFAYALGPWLGIQILAKLGAPFLWSGTLAISVLTAVLFATAGAGVGAAAREDGAQT